jgi:hypothetical protein
MQWRQVPSGIHATGFKYRRLSEAEPDESCHKSYPHTDVACPCSSASPGKSQCSYCSSAPGQDTSPTSPRSSLDLLFPTQIWVGVVKLELHASAEQESKAATRDEAGDVHRSEHFGRQHCGRLGQNAGLYEFATLCQ